MAIDQLFEKITCIVATESVSLYDADEKLTVFLELERVTRNDKSLKSDDFKWRLVYSPPIPVEQCEIPCAPSPLRGRVLFSL